MKLFLLRTDENDRDLVSTYADALEQHMLPVPGDYWYDALAKVDVQKWAMTVSARSGRRRAGRRSVTHEIRSMGWFRLFRTMTRDAVDALHLPTDPCVRIRFPQGELSEGSNVLDPEELLRFLAEMRVRYPHHYAMVTLLAFTGLRFCHASALKWDDWDEDKTVLHVRRKNVRGEIAPVSRRKRAPSVIPVEPELAEVLREHRARLAAAKAPGFSQGWMFPEHDGSGVGEVPRCREGEAPLHGARPAVHVHRPDPAVKGGRRRPAGADRTRDAGDAAALLQRRTDEKRAAIAGALRLLADAKAAQQRVNGPAGVNSGVNRGGAEEVAVS